MREEWRPVKGYEGLYEVSNTGKVASLNYNHTGARCELKQQSNNGYKTVPLAKDKVHKNVLVHRAVAEAFIDNPNNLPCINHISEDKSDNSVENLEWCTKAYNNTYGTRLSRVAKALAKPVRQTSLNGSEIARYSSLVAVKNSTGYDISHVAKVCRGIKGYKTAYGYKWEYIKEGDINGE